MQEQYLKILTILFYKSLIKTEKKKIGAFIRRRDISKTKGGCKSSQEGSWLHSVIICFEVASILKHTSLAQGNDWNKRCVVLQSFLSHPCVSRHSHLFEGIREGVLSLTQRTVLQGASIQEQECPPGLIHALHWLAVFQPEPQLPGRFRMDWVADFYF